MIEASGAMLSTADAIAVGQVNDTLVQAPAVAGLNSQNVNDNAPRMNVDTDTPSAAAAASTRWRNSYRSPQRGKRHDRRVGSAGGSCAAASL
jgi:hypothetical protein